MAIASYKPSSPVTPKQNLPQVQPKAYRGSVVQDRDTPVLGLMAFMEGSPWSVDYYSLIGSEHNDLREMDSAAPDIYQTYQKIINFEIRVSSALQDSYDTASGISSVVGNGLMVNVIVPNKGDLFTSDAGDDRVGLFNITLVERKSFNTQSVYYVEYSLLGFVDSLAIKSRYDDLESKVAKTYHFSKDRLLENLSPLVNTTENNHILNLGQSYKSLVKYYFKSFYNKRFYTLLLPGQEATICDILLNNFVMTLVDVLDSEEIQSVRRVPTDGDVYLNRDNIWSVLLNRDNSLLKQIWNKAGLVHRKSFLINNTAKGLAFVNVDYIVYPKDIEESLLTSRDKLPKTVLIQDVIPTKNYAGTAADLLNTTYTTPTSTKFLYHRVTEDDYYVFSSNFYNNTTNQSVIEILTKDYLDNKTLDLNMLYALINDYYKWSRLEQFYYGPILILLIKEANRSRY